MQSVMRPRTLTAQRLQMQVIGEETLVYDELNHQAWCLNSSAACVWRLCNGANTVEQIAAQAGLELNAPMTSDSVLLTLADLQEKNLLDSDSVTLLPDHTTRRQMMSRMGLATAALLPLVASILAPPAHAQSGSFTGMANPNVGR